MIGDGARENFEEFPPDARAGGTLAAVGAADIVAPASTTNHDAHAPRQQSYTVVTDHGIIAYHSQGIGKYLELPTDGSPANVLSTARGGLRRPLLELFRDAVSIGSSGTHSVLLNSKADEFQRQIDITIVRVDGHTQNEPLYLITFEDRGSVAKHPDIAPPVVPPRQAAPLEIQQKTIERLKSIDLDLEASFEKLRISIEDLVADNEDMVSINMELDDTKEELFNLNDELHLSNQELTDRISELDRAHNDLRNLFENTDVATIFLDKNLFIRGFTPAVSNIFDILPTDCGRRISDLEIPQQLREFADSIEEVSAGGNPVERRIENDEHSAYYFVRIVPYREHATDGTDGVVITFINLTNLTRSEVRQRLLIAELQHRTRNLLGVVQSLAEQTLGKGAALKSFSMRLSALGRVQSLVSSMAGDRIDLGEIVRLELDAIASASHHDGKITISGPPVALQFELVQTLALALHELATNALKYGALKVEQGRLEIQWKIVRKKGVPLLSLIWRETGVTSIPASPRMGFGRLLIERALGFTLQAKTNLTLGNGGVVCRIEIPLFPDTEDASQHQAAFV